MKSLWLHITCIVMLVASCRTQNLVSRSTRQAPAIDSAFVFDSAYQYRVAADDKINLSIWGQDELSVGSVYGIYNSNEAYGKWLLVDANGHVEIPRIGTLHVTGLTVPQLKDTVKTLLSRWIINPVVDIRIMNKQITVLGEVRNPGAVHIDEDRIPLLEAIARAEGNEFYANLKSVKVIRQENGLTRVTEIDLTCATHYEQRNIRLHPGDVVIITSKHHKAFDKRIATIIPVASTITSLAILIGLFH